MFLDLDVMFRACCQLVLAETTLEHLDGSWGEVTGILLPSPEAWRSKGYAFGSRRCAKILNSHLPCGPQQLKITCKIKETTSRQSQKLPIEHIEAHFDLVFAVEAMGYLDLAEPLGCGGSNGLQTYTYTRDSCLLL